MFEEIWSSKLRCSIGRTTRATNSVICAQHTSMKGACVFFNLLPTAPCFRITYTHEDYMENSFGGYRSPLMEIPGFRKECVLEDWMHDVHLGVGHHLAASVLVFICGGRSVTNAVLDVGLDAEWGRFNDWCSQHKIQCSMPQFSRAFFHMKKATSFPELRAKAHPCKMLLSYLADRVRVLAERNHENVWKLLAACTYSIASLHSIMDHSDMFFDDDVCRQFYQHGTLFLASYMSLHSWAIDASAYMFNIIPKCHMMAHVIFSIHEDRRNPKFYHCYGDEDFVGRIAKIGARVHPKSMAKRTLERYLIGVHQRFAASGEPVVII